MSVVIRSLLCAAFGLGATVAFAGEDAQGQAVFEKWCMPCHGKGDYPGTLALEARYQGAVPAALEERSDLSPELVKYFVRNGISVMPFFRKTEVSDLELEALTRYLYKPAPVVAQP